jgi:transcriptional regulator NrdR family protein
MVSGPECPECESRKTRCLSTGYSDEGYRIRRRKCVDCDAPSFITAEVVIPDATWGELETSYRDRYRDRYRIKNSAQPKPYLIKRPSSLRVSVQVRRAA